jgi:hypothetical protein
LGQQGDDRIRDRHAATEMAPVLPETISVALIGTKKWAGGEQTVRIYPWLARAAAAPDCAVVRRSSQCRRKHPKIQPAGRLRKLRPAG